MKKMSITNDRIILKIKLKSNKSQKISFITLYDSLKGFSWVCLEIAEIPGVGITDSTFYFLFFFQLFTPN